MAGEQNVSGHITWKQQAGSVLQQRKIFRSSPTTRRSHFIWPGGCGQWIDTFPAVRVGYAVIHLSVAPSHFFPLLVPFFSPLTNLTFIFFKSPPQLLLSLPPFPLNFLLLCRLLSVLSFFPLQQPYLIVYLSLVSPFSYLPLQTLSFLPLSPSFSLCLWSVTLNITPSICFSSFV